MFHQHLYGNFSVYFRLQLLNWVPRFAAILPNVVSINSIKNCLCKRCSTQVPKMLVKLTSTHWQVGKKSFVKKTNIKNIIWRSAKASFNYFFGETNQLISGLRTCTQLKLKAKKWQIQPPIYKIRNCITKRFQPRVSTTLKLIFSKIIKNINV